MPQEQEKMPHSLILPMPLRSISDHTASDQVDPQVRGQHLNIVTVSELSHLLLRAE